MDEFDTPPAGGHAHTTPGRSSRTTRWAAGLVLAALLIGGGSVLGVHLANAGAKPTEAVLASNARLDGARGAASGESAHATVHSGPASRRACVAVARHLRASGNRAAARAKLASCRRGSLRRLRFALLGGLHGQVTFKTKGGFRTVAFERGLVQSVSSSSVVVKAADGTAITWALGSKTMVRQAGQRAGTGASALHVGQRVLVIGQVVKGADDARLIRIRRSS